jgi:phosphatidylglycerol lysyltransferase
MANPKLLSFATTRAVLPPRQIHRLIGKAALAALSTIIFIWLLVGKVSDISIENIHLQLLTVSAQQWLTAALATAASFWAIGHYDGAIHRHLAIGTPPATARQAGAAAIAVSQTLGLGIITGAIVRWRMLPDQTLWQAAKITSLVTLFFLSAWAIVTAITVAILPNAPFKPVASCILALPPLIVMVCAAAPRLRSLPWPNLFTTACLLAFAAIDTLAAALALWLMCPPDLALPFVTLLPAFLIAFGAGLLSGTPGGVGAFEITLLALLPAMAEAPLLAAVLAWRIVYFAAPALIGAAVTIRGPSGNGHKTRVSAPCNGLTANAKRAETGLLAQGHLQLIGVGYDVAWLTGRTPHCLIGLLDPLSAHPGASGEPTDLKQAIATLIDTARSESKLPVIYKCTARTAVAARRLGLALRPIAREAWLDPRAFALNTPPRAGLRRKLRRATAAGITISTAPPDWPQLASIAKQWAQNHGGERGFSMGRFDRNYLSGQRLYVAYQGLSPVAFASFHAGKFEWTLDLMRHTSNAPDGTMQALIAQAIADAATLQLPRLSLSAVPLAALIPPPTAWIAALIHGALGGNQTGLAQFKSSFVPKWQTLYLAAPHKPGLALAGAEIAREVRSPPPLRPSSHHHHEQYEIASGARAWHMEA